MRTVYYLPVIFFLLLPPSYALLVPHNTYYNLDWMQKQDVCLTVYTNKPADLNVECGGEFVSSQPVPPGNPLTLCVTITGDRSKMCKFTMDGETAYVVIHVFPKSITEAILSVLLVFLIVRFAAKLTRIYTKSR